MPNRIQELKLNVDSVFLLRSLEYGNDEPTSAENYSHFEPNTSEEIKHNSDPSNQRIKTSEKDRTSGDRYDKYMEKQKILEMALGAAHAGVWSWNVSQKIFDWDRQMLTLFNLSKDNQDVGLRYFLKRVHPKDRQKLILKLKHSLAQQQDININYRIVDGEGNQKFIKTIGSFSEKHDMFSGICMDITRDMQIENALKASEQKFHAALDFSPIGVGIVDLQGNWLEVNRALTKMFGYSFKEMLELNFQKMTYPDDLAGDMKLLEQLIDGKIATYQLDKRYYKKDGTIFWGQLNVSLVRNKNGIPQYFISHVQEITKRKEEEKKILEIVEQRTTELKNANKELEAFSYSVSHDLRSPLRSIHGFSQALLEDYSEQLDLSGQNYLKRVSSASVKMGLLIDNLLLLSRITRQELTIAPLDISKIAREIIEDLSKEYPNTNFVIQPNIKGMGDKGLISIVMENFLSNAAKYSRNQSLPSVSLLSKQMDGKQVLLVQDNGVGFDMNYSTKLFGAFQRLHSEKEFEGTGIGLATVKRILTRHGEEVWAEASINEGATFYFTLKQK